MSAISPRANENFPLLLNEKKRRDSFRLLAESDHCLIATQDETSDLLKSSYGTMRGADNRIQWISNVVLPILEGLKALYTHRSQRTEQAPAHRSQPHPFDEEEAVDPLKELYECPPDDMEEMKRLWDNRLDIILEDALETHARRSQERNTELDRVCKSQYKEFIEKHRVSVSTGTDFVQISNSLQERHKSCAESSWSSSSNQGLYKALSCLTKKQKAIIGRLNRFSTEGAIKKAQDELDAIYLAEDSNVVFLHYKHHFTSLYGRLIPVDEYRQLINKARLVAKACFSFDSNHYFSPSQFHGRISLEQLTVAKEPVGKIIAKRYSGGNSACEEVEKTINIFVSVIDNLREIQAEEQTVSQQQGERLHMRRQTLESRIQMRKDSGEILLDVWDACKKGPDELFRKHLDRVENVNEVHSGFGFTLLDYAVCIGCVPKIRLLLARGADPTTMNGSGFSTMHRAAALGNEEILQLLLNQDTTNRANQLSSTSVLYTPLHCAIQPKLFLDPSLEGYQEKYKNARMHVIENIALLISKGAKINHDGVKPSLFVFAIQQFMISNSSSEKDAINLSMIAKFLVNLNMMSREDLLRGIELLLKHHPTEVEQQRLGEDLMRSLMTYDAFAEPKGIYDLVTLLSSGSQRNLKMEFQILNHLRGLLAQEKLSPLDLFGENEKRISQVAQTLKAIVPIPTAYMSENVKPDLLNMVYGQIPHDIMTDEPSSPRRARRPRSFSIHSVKEVFEKVVSPRSPRRNSLVSPRSSRTTPRSPRVNPGSPRLLAQQSAKS